MAKQKKIKKMMGQPRALVAMAGEGTNFFVNSFSSSS